MPKLKIKTLLDINSFDAYPSYHWKATIPSPTVRKRTNDHLVSNVVRFQDEDQFYRNSNLDINKSSPKIPKLKIKTLLDINSFDTYPSVSYSDKGSHRQFQNYSSTDDFPSGNIYSLTENVNVNSTSEVVVSDDDFSSENVPFSDADSSISDADAVSDVVPVSEVVEKAFQELRIQYAKNILKPVEAPSETNTYSRFDEVEFASYFGGKFTLMRKILSSFSVRPYIDPKCSLSNNDQLVMWEDEIKSHRAYHAPNDMPNSEIAKAFFDTYNHAHFLLGAEDANVFPVGLYTFDSKFDEEWRKYNFKDSLIGSLSNRFRRERFDGYLKVIDMCKDPIYIHNFIDKHFKRAWDLQSDGDQTNATLVRGSLIKFSKALVHLLEPNDRIVDLGSSYGSLIWIVVSIINAFNGELNISGEGWEYSDKRHKLGCASTCQMLNEVSGMEYKLLAKYDVDLRHNDIFEFKDLGPSNKVAFCFDKVFPADLLLHILLIVIQSKNIRLFISCKEHVSKGKNKCMLHGSEFKYNEIMDYLKTYFRKKKMLNGYQMRFSSESAGSFAVYEVIEHTIVDDVFFNQLYESFLSKRGLNHKGLKKIKDRWNNAKECLDSPARQNRSLESSIDFYNSEIQYIDKIIHGHLQCKRNKKKIFTD